MQQPPPSFPPSSTGTKLLVEVPKSSPAPNTCTSGPLPKLLTPFPLQCSVDLETLLLITATDTVSSTLA